MPFNVISEESGLTSRGFERNLLVDPLDGTFNAEVGFPFYSLSVADVGTDLRSVRYGFVMNLNSGEFYYAESGKGAYRNGARIRVSESTVGCSIGNLGKYPDRSMNPLIRSPGRIRSIGCASLELCLLAQGSADVVSYMGPGNYVRNVDIGAGYIILIEAGGQILDGDGKPLNMGLDVRERKNFIAVRSREELEEFL
ncbi:hypothetical protein ApAK_08725 [Thermoplasmatales archaeon AK]|nr:hypothetical protein [Thermoplasmatales archaeon AK]